jgi:CHASE2 domain-containing sensor protein
MLLSYNKADIRKRRDEMRINDIPLAMLLCLVSTVLIECLLALLWKVRRPRDLVIVALVNVATNPMLVSLCYGAAFWMGPSYYYPVMVVLEILVFLIEGCVYSRFLPKQKHPFLLSLSLNVGSIILGYGVNHLFF